MNKKQKIKEVPHERKLEGLHNTKNKSQDCTKRLTPPYDVLKVLSQSQVNKSQRSYPKVPIQTSNNAQNLLQPEKDNSSRFSNHEKSSKTVSAGSNMPQTGRNDKEIVVEVLENQDKNYSNPDDDFDDDLEDELLKKLKSRASNLLQNTTKQSINGVNSARPSIEKIERSSHTQSKSTTSNKSPVACSMALSGKKGLGTNSLLDDSFFSDEGFDEDMNFSKLLNSKNKPPLIRVKPKNDHTNPETIFTSEHENAFKLELQMEDDDSDSIIEISDDTLSNLSEKRGMNSNFDDTSETTKTTLNSAYFINDSYKSKTEKSITKIKGDSHLTNKSEPTNTPNFVINNWIDIENEDLIYGGEVANLDDYNSGAMDYDPKDQERLADIERDTDDAEIINKLVGNSGNQEDNESDIDSMFGSDVEIV